MYTLLELSNNHYGDTALKNGNYHSSYKSLREAKEALMKLEKELKMEYDKYDYPYNKAPYHYRVVDKNGVTLA